MTTPAAATSVHHEIVVNAPIARAFSVFTEDFGSFKPPEHNLLGVEIAETVFEPRAGGRLYDRGIDGSECNWARVLAYEPPDRVVISWDIATSTVTSRAGRPRPRSRAGTDLPAERVRRGKAPPYRRGSRRDAGQAPVDELHDHRPLTDGGGASLDRP
jgi:uncharacterized protein YndB with AHSA1/START domain